MYGVSGVGGYDIDDWRQEGDVEAAWDVMSGNVICSFLD